MDRVESRPVIKRTWRLGLFIGSVLVLVACLGVRYAWRADEASAQSPSTASAPVAQSQPKLNIVALVNGEEISRNDLGRQCLWHFGEEVLESVVNRQLIEQHCQEMNIRVSEADVQAEIHRVAQSFGLPVDQWLKLLENDRQVGPRQYAQEIIWPKLALERLAAPALQVSQQELQEAFELQFGPSVQCRIIVTTDQASAQKAHAAAVANPDDFGNLAKSFSEDASASSKGLIQPIRKHMGDDVIEKAAFALQPNQISNPLVVGNQFVILKCERHYPAQNVNFEAVRERLTQAIRERKLGDEANKLLADLQAKAQVQNTFNDPQLQAQHPGVAAIVNGRNITMRELAEACIDRHGSEVLEGTIDRKLLEQACRSKNIQISQEDLNKEIARAAKSMGKDVDTWLAELKEQGVEMELYVHDTVWPTAALKKLVGTEVEVTDEDLQKGYEANYGPRVRCLAIVLNNQRQAQEVWEMARANPSKEYFGELAAQYSVEAGSKGLKGEVPPIQKHGGQPNLEKEAFGLKPGELSGLVHIGDNWIILHCLGRTTPTPVNFEDVRDEIFADLLEKKQRISMAKTFSGMQKVAKIDNFLDNTSTAHSRELSADLPASSQPQGPPVRRTTATEPAQRPKR
ncbi:unnamed protein product [Cladocopium goreaui]|uniref:peptidylprolyl isomerase n=1 Tax=Cladocopium goreaui TaxID=2562237 RepID=A0A9P1BF75_9DINO|nr:unnamed protein product [Cladocopium goreaui]